MNSQEKARAQDLRRGRWWQEKIQNAVCYYCAIAVTPKTATMDHIVPIAQGGTSTKGNVVVCCKACNTKKRDRTAVEWILDT